MVQPWIFISHVNGDPIADQLVNALKNGLIAALGEGYDGYEIKVDQGIPGGKEWWEKICKWMWRCAAAVILISPRALGPDKPWVSHESTILANYKRGPRKELGIIPICLMRDETKVKQAKCFEPSEIWRYNIRRFEEMDKPGIIDEIVSCVASDLRAHLQEYSKERLVGLADALRQNLEKFPEEALRAAAACLDPGAVPIGNKDQQAKQVAKRLIEADDVDAARAFKALCNAACVKTLNREKENVALALVSERIREEFGRPIALHAADTTGAGDARSLYVESSNDNIIDLYLTRAARNSPHGWTVENLDTVLENGQAADAVDKVKMHFSKYSVGAGSSENEKVRQLRNLMKFARKAGTPFVSRISYPGDTVCGEVARSIKNFCEHLMVLYCATGENTTCDDEKAPILRIGGAEYHDDLMGFIAALKLEIQRTTPQEEAPR